MDMECHYALVAQQLDGFTAKRQRQLLEYCQSYSAIFEADPSDYPTEAQPVIAGLQAHYREHSWQRKLDHSQQRLERCGAQVIPITSSDYPILLNQTDGAPPILYVRGNSDNLHLPQIAVVGSRRVTRGGETNALEWSEFLARHGFVFTSGLARGVDGLAHEGALKAQGKTIAVMGTGIDVVYPRAHNRLAEQIVSQGGTLVTEFEPGAEPRPSHFPRRNRIISGLSLGVLVVEAAIRSGSLMTARLALEQNRDVFAIPGSIHNPQSRGCHHLIKQGAHLVECAGDIVGELHSALGSLQPIEGLQPLERLDGHATANTALPPNVSIDSDERRLLEAIGFDPVDMDALARDGQFSSVDLFRLLVSLELKGLVENQHGAYQRLR